MNQVTTQTVTSQVTPVESPPSGSSVREVDTTEALDRLFSLLTREKRFKGHFASNLSPLPWLVVDFSSVQPHFEVRSETSLVEEHLVRRIKRLIDKLIADSEVINEVDKGQVVESFLGLVQTLSLEQLTSITDQELTRRMQKMLLIEAVSGILNELTPAQAESFEAAVKRRELFK